MAILGHPLLNNTYPEDQPILSLSPLILDAANVSEVECACHIATELPFR
jgi:hypothetical protein